MRCLGIDYGTKRVGLAHGESDIGVATPLTALVDECHCNTGKVRCPLIAALEDSGAPLDRAVKRN